MNDPEHNELLLADVLGEGVSADFREGLLSASLRLARRRRRLRQVRQATSALVVLVGLGLWAWHQLPSGRVPAGLPVKPYALVHTQPLPPAARVRTTPLPPSSLVASATNGTIIVTTGASGRIQEINDDELLALAPKPAVLVRLGPHSAELVFVNAADREALQRN